MEDSEATQILPFANTEEEKRESVFPEGVRFKPKESELVEYYLLPMLEGKPIPPNNAIIEADVYEREPSKLIEKFKNSGEDADAWYFLSPRARKYTGGIRPSRTTDDKHGRWKASTGKGESAELVGEEGIRYCDSVLAYFEGSIRNERKTKWLMRELTVPRYENKGDKKKLDAYVMCKIYVSPRHKEDGKDKVTDSTETSTSGALGGSSSHSDGATPQRSKRRMEEQPCSAESTAPKQRRLKSTPLGSSPGCGPSTSSRMEMPQAATMRAPNAPGHAARLPSSPRAAPQPHPSTDRAYYQLFCARRNQPDPYLDQQPRAAPPVRHATSAAQQQQRSMAFPQQQWARPLNGVGSQRHVGATGQPFASSSNSPYGGGQCSSPVFLEARAAGGGMVAPASMSAAPSSFEVENKGGNFDDLQARINMAPRRSYSYKGRLIKFHH